MLEHETTIRLGAFFGLFFLLSMFEYFLPRRELLSRRVQRWSIHLTLLLSAIVFSRIALPVAATEFAYIYGEKELGLFSLLKLPLWLTCILSLVILDFSIYIQHVLFHRWPLLWRFHKVHHCDKEMDVSTAIRFHPVEILISTIYKISIIALLGAPVLSVLIFELLLNAGALFSHSNIRLKSAFDKYLRKIIVTPDMHLIHHSIHPTETNSNYGFFLSVWDRIFSSYTDKPRDGYTNMELGLKTYTKENTLNFLWTIVLPFKK